MDGREKYNTKGYSRNRNLSNKVSDVSECPYRLSEMERAVLMAYCGVGHKWKKSPSYLDAYLAIQPKTPINTAYELSSRMFNKLKNSGALEWFLENTGLSIRACTDALKQSLIAETVDTHIYPDGTFDYRSRPDNMTRLFAARSTLKLHGTDRQIEAVESTSGKSLSQLVMENEEQND